VLDGFVECRVAQVISPFVCRARLPGDSMFGRLQLMSDSKFAGYDVGFVDDWIPATAESDGHRRSGIVFIVAQILFTLPRADGFWSSLVSGRLRMRRIPIPARR
jgi:hypothetical protein